MCTVSWRQNSITAGYQAVNPPSSVAGRQIYVLPFFALEWEEQLLCKQAVLHLDVMVHENSSAESAVTSLADPVRWCICASVMA